MIACKSLKDFGAVDGTEQSRYWMIICSTVECTET